jgi:hypothetical protein
MLDSEQLTDTQRGKDTKCKLCGRFLCGRFPASHIISDGLNKVGELPARGGGFSDVWEGSYRCQKVAIKVPRLYSSTDPAIAMKVSLLYPILNNKNV